MELKRRFDARKVFIVVSWFVMVVYLWIGLQPAEATQIIAGRLEIPSISLSSDVTELELAGSKLETPDTIVGSYTQHPGKILLIGHSTTAFQNLNELKLRELIEYDGKTYSVVRREIVRKEEISMTEVLAGSERDTLILMTCAGTLLDGGESTHRLLVTAVATE